MENMQGWKEKLLSRAGKEVLLKAVIQAIPTYLMRVYKFPISLIQEIHSMMARFWWGSSDSKRKIHWKSWEGLCQPKCLAGMGFRDLGVFNDALLGKKILRLMSNENSILSRVLKAKYFPHSSILEAALGPCSSYSWRSIWSSKALVRDGMVWRVGNGAKINVWDDPWLINDTNRVATSVRNVDEDVLVADLINTEEHCWDMEKVDRIFNTRDKNLVLAIPISERLPADSIAWAWSKDGNYEVSSAIILVNPIMLLTLRSIGLNCGMRMPRQMFDIFCGGVALTPCLLELCCGLDT